MSKKTKKALFIAGGISAGKPGVSGGETRFIEIAKHWAKLGYKIELLSSSGGKYICNKFGLKVKLHQLRSIFPDSRLSFVFRGLSMFFLPKSTQKFTQGIVYSTSEQSYDVIPGIIMKLKNKKRIQHVVVVHWLPPHLWWERQQSSFINSFLFLISERMGLYLALLFSDIVLPVSHSTHNQIKTNFLGRHFLHKVTTVACGVNIDEVKKIIKPVKKKKYDAVFMKRIQAVKGIFDLIKIWEIVVKKKPRAKLIVIGSGIDENEAKKIAIEKGLEKNIDFLGVILDKKKKFELIAESKVFLLPTYEENWAIVIGESMAAGTPVVSYGLKELKTIWKNNFVSVPTGNHKLFARKTLDLLSSSQKRARISNLAKAFIQRYDWGSIADHELSKILPKNN